MSESHLTAANLAAQMADTVTQRAEVYGAPEKNFGSIADFWRTWIATRHGMLVPLDATDVGMMSALIKVARLGQTPAHEDSALDAATYLLLAHGCVDQPASEGDVKQGVTLRSVEKVLGERAGSPPPNHPFPKYR